MFKTVSPRLLLLKSRVTGNCYSVTVDQPHMFTYNLPSRNKRHTHTEVSHAGTPGTMEISEARLQVAESWYLNPFSLIIWTPIRPQHEQIRNWIRDSGEYFISRDEFFFGWLLAHCKLIYGMRVGSPAGLSNLYREDCNPGYLHLMYHCSRRRGSEKPRKPLSL